MSPERWDQIQRVLDAVLESVPEAWPAVLDEACAGRSELRREVETLLRRYTQAERFLDTPAAEAAALLVAEAQAEEAAISVENQRVGPYRIRREIGRGGMGAVYLAERADGAFEQQVALKLLRQGLDTADARRRFRAERQILAQLQHPTIARLLDGGATEPASAAAESHQPYLVMEYIEGRPLDRYCDARRLPVEERLHLFTTVVETVQHAHRNLVVHRDLKPSNILVTDAGEVKLLDFGIAKLLEDAEGPEPMPPTRTGQRWMTPEYAAPEQIRGEAVTTATDIYQLGVVLYELLTGRRPFERDGGSLHDLEQAVLDEEPAKLSTAVSRMPTRASEADATTVDAVSRARRTRPKRLQRMLRGDLDTIVLKALRKEPEARYASAEAFLEDIKRHLAGRPVQARRGTVAYRARKFVRRHRGGVGVAVAFLVLIVGFAAAMTVQANRIAQERDRAQLETRKAEQVTTFLTELFEANEPGEALGDTVTARTLLERGVERAEALDDQPEVQAEMMHAIGQAYMSLGRYETAQPLLERALAIRKSVYGPVHERVAETLNSLGRLLRLRGTYDEAESLHREALAMRRALLGPEHVDVAASLNNLAVALHVRGDLGAAEPLYREALAMRRKLLGEAHEDIAVNLNNLGLLLRAKGDFEAAEPLLRESLAMRRTLLGPEHPKIAIGLGNLALLFRDKGDYDRAESHFRDALAMWRELLGPEHPHVATALNDLGVVLLDKGNLEEAEPLLREALALRRELLGPEHPKVAQSLHNLAGLLRTRGDLEAAEARYREALALRRELLGPEHRLVAATSGKLATLLHAKNDYEAAEPLYRRAIEIQSTAVGNAHWRTAHFKSRLGACLAARDRYEEAEPLLIEGYEGLKAERGNRDRYTREALERLVAFYAAWGKPDEAADYRALQADRAGADPRR